MERLPVVAVLLAVLASPAFADEAPAPPSILHDPLFRERARVGLESLYDMDMGAAQDAFAEISARHPGHPVGPFLEALLPWWSIQLEPDDPSEDEALLAAMERVVEICDGRLERDAGDVDALFFKSGAHALRGRLHADRRHWLRAARDGREALLLLEEVVRLDPDNPDLGFGLGLFDYLADVVPERYKVLRPFARLFPEGDRARGLAELLRARDQGRFVSTEAAYSLLQLHYFFEKDYVESLLQVRWLRARHPANSIFHLYEGRIQERLGNLPEAERILEEVRDRHAKGQSGYTDALAERALYLLARVEMHRGRHEEALALIQQLERLTAGRPEVLSEYRALGRLRKGMALDALGRREDAVSCYRDVLAFERGYEGAGNVRKLAKGYLKKPFSS